MMTFDVDGNTEKGLKSRRIFNLYHQTPTLIRNKITVNRNEQSEKHLHITQQMERKWIVSQPELSFLFFAVNTNCFVMNHKSDDWLL